MWKRGPLVVEPVSADLFLILPSYVCKPTLATTDIFHLGVFAFFYFFGCIMFVATCRLSLVLKVPYVSLPQSFLT